MRPDREHAESGAPDDVASAEDQSHTAVRWSTAIEAIENPICLLDDGGKIVQCNRAMLRMLDITPAEIEGQHCWHLIHGSDEPPEGCPTTLARRSMCSETKVMQLGDQRVEITVDPILNEHGEFTGVMHSITDTTFRHRPCDEIMEHARELQLIATLNRAANEGASLDGVLHLTTGKMTEMFAGATVFAHLVSADGKSVLVQDRNTAADDEEADDIYGSLLTRHGVSLEVVDAYSKAVDAGEPVILREADAISQLLAEHERARTLPDDLCEREDVPPDYRASCATGVRSVVVAPLACEGTPLGLLELWFPSDIDEGQAERVSRIAAQLTTIIRRLRSEENFRRILDSTAEGMLITDIDTGRFTYANAAICAMLGYSQEELQSLGVQDVHPAEDGGRACTVFSAEAVDDLTLASGISFVKKNGRVFDADLRTIPMVIDGSMCDVGFVTDVSHRADAEDQLRRRLKFERIISTASTVFINLRAGQLNKAMIRTLANAGRFLDLDSCHVCMFPDDPETEQKTYDWCMEGTNPSLKKLGEVAWLTSTRSRMSLLDFRPVLISSLDDLSSEDAELEKRLRALGISSVMVTPIMFDGDVIGIFSASTCRSEREWSAEAISLLTTLGELYVSATRRAGSSDALATVLDRQHRAMDGTVKALSSIGELRDPYTAGHQRRVAEFARAIALELGMSGERAEGIHVAAMLHDIGKMHVPAEILVRPGPVDDLEFDIIRTHTQVGYDMLKDIDFPWPVAEVALKHHERMDGSGYPLGLKGDDIPLEARIVAVADVVEAMSSYRPFRPALPIEAAIKEITLKKGVLYCPDVVDVALDLLTKKGFRFAEETDRAGRRQLTGS